MVSLSTGTFRVLVPEGSLACVAVSSYTFLAVSTGEAKIALDPEHSVIVCGKS